MNESSNNLDLTENKPIVNLPFCQNNFILCMRYNLSLRSVYFPFFSGIPVPLYHSAGADWEAHVPNGDCAGPIQSTRSTECLALCPCHAR